MERSTQSLETLQDIRKIMDRSSRFISLSGLSGVSAGILALAGAYIAHEQIESYELYTDASLMGFDRYSRLVYNLMGLAAGLLALVFIVAFYFTWRKARRDVRPLWDSASRRMIINLFIPLVAGGLFIIGMLYHGVWQFVAPACLVFYGLACVNGSKYTYTEIRYLGICEIILGVLNVYFINYGIYFWAFGFGVLHIVYGMLMWWKYERVRV